MGNQNNVINILEFKESKLNAQNQIKENSKINNFTLLAQPDIQDEENIKSLENNMVELENKIKIAKANKIKPSYYKSLKQAKNNLQSLKTIGFFSESKVKSPFNKNQQKSKDYKIDLSSLFQIRNQSPTINYDILDEIGKGSYGRVYRVRHNFSKQIRVMKVVKKESKQGYYQNPQIYILKKIRHPNIIRVYDIYLYRDDYYVVMQYASGGPIHKAKFNKSQQHIKCIIKQILSALHYCHVSGIYHRDISASNILFLKQVNLNTKPQDLKIKIIDFGLAINTKHRLHTNIALKKIPNVNYAAPQTIQNKFNEKSDVWSVGVILYTLISNGIYPFTGFSNEQTQNNILNRQINYSDKKWKQYSYQLKGFLKKTLQKNHSKRPLALECIKDELFQKDKQQNNRLQITLNFLQNITLLNRSNKFTFIIKSQIILKYLSNQEYAKICQIFLILDKYREGRISINTFKKILKTQTLQQYEQLQYIFNIVDINKSGFLEFQQFLIVLAGNMEFKKQYLQEIFNLIDINKSGYIKKQELQIILGKQYYEAYAIELQLDINADHKISCQQFLHYFQKH